LTGTFATELNLTGKSLFACIRLDSGLYPTGADFTSTACATVQLDVGKNGNLDAGSFRNYICPSATNQWFQVWYPIQPTFGTDPETGQQVYLFDPAHTAMFDIYIRDPDVRNLPAGDGGLLLPTTAQFHIDTIGYR
jgi:hypothetical protein